MSQIILDCGIDGEETLADYVGKISCTAMEHGIDMPVVPNNTDRTDGASVHGSIVLTHAMDKATPNLRKACCAGTNIDNITITRIKVVGGSAQASDLTKLKTCNITAVWTDTLLGQDGMPTGDVVEKIQIDYEEIKWEHKQYAGGILSNTISGSYDTATLSTTVTIA